MPKPEVENHQALIEVKACALNHFDLFVLREADPENTSFPFWRGAYIAGVVAQAGQLVNKFKAVGRQRLPIAPGVSAFARLQAVWKRGN